MSTYKKYKESTRPEMHQNYGTDWQRNTYKFILEKCAEGVNQKELLRAWIIEMGLSPNKCLEFVGDLLSTDLLMVKDGKYFSEKEKPSTDPEMKPYLKAKKKLVDKKSKNDEIAVEDRGLYQIYSNSCGKAGEKPLTYNQWLTNKYKAETQTP